MPAITRRQCRCVCREPNDPPDVEGLPTCSCRACADSPCYYIVDFGCCVECDGLRGGCDGCVRGLDENGNPYNECGTASNDSGGNKLTTKAITRLWKDDCITENNCRWTARVNADPYSATCEEYAGLCGNCGWKDWMGFEDDSSIVPLSRAQKCSYWLDNCTRVAWELVVNGTTATLTGTSGSGATIVYKTRGSEPWRCHVRRSHVQNMLYMTSYPDSLPLDKNGGECKKFPRAVCITAGVRPFQTYCADKESVCNCCDAGWASHWFKLSVGCIDSVLVKLTRQTSTEPHFSGLPIPTNAACGYLIGATNGCLGGIAGRVGIVMYCDGTTWNVKLYCYYDSAWTLFCDTTATVTVCCAPYLAYTYTCVGPVPSPCCCEGCLQCDYNTIPASLNMVITGPGNGTGTMSGGAGVWCGAVTLSNGDRMSIELSMAACAVRVGCNGSDCSTFNCIAPVPVITINSCDPFDATVTFTAGIFCGACGSGAYTVHIFE